MGYTGLFFLFWLFGVNRKIILLENIPASQIVLYSTSTGVLMTPFFGVLRAFSGVLSMPLN